MCGISGILHLQADTLTERALIARMNDTLTHRGPDDQGSFVAPGVGLGMRRLEVIDLVTGRQMVDSFAHGHNSTSAFKTQRRFQW